MKLKKYEIKLPSLFSLLETSIKDPNLTYQERLNISDEVLADYYRVAAQLLEEKNWKDASDAFLFLIFLNPFFYEFWLGIGIAQQAQHLYDKALIAYIMAESIEPQNPIPQANRFQCHFALGEYEQAERSWHKAMENCRHDEISFSMLKHDLRHHPFALQKKLS